MEEMSVIFCLFICTATAKNSNVGNENILLEFVFLGFGGGIILRRLVWKKLH